MIRRARLIRVLAVYLTASFVVLQVVDIFVQQLGLPDWFFPGALAFALLIGSVSGFMGMRALGIGPIGSLVAAGVLDARERVLVADFQSQNGDTLLAGVLTEAFRVDLSQSPLVTVVEPAFVQDALQRTARPRGPRLDPELASELVLRAGIKAVVAGDVGAAGAGYVISVRLLSPGTQEVLAAFRETAVDSTAVIGEAGRISGRLAARTWPYRRGDQLLWRGCISAHLGKLDTAVSLIQEAAGRGARFEHAHFCLDPLRDHPPFREFTRPKG